MPARNIIGEQNRGWYVGLTLLDYERSSVVSAINDRLAVEQLAEYSRGGDGASQSRIANYPTIRAEVADRYIETEVQSNLSLRIASMQAAGFIPNYEEASSCIASYLVRRRVHAAISSWSASLCCVVDPRVRLAHHVVAQIQLLNHARAVVLHEDI